MIQSKTPKKDTATKPRHRSARGRSPVESFLALSDAEKEAAYRSVDREFTPDELETLTPAERRWWDRLRRELVRKHRGRPRTGRGAKAISVTVEVGLLERVDAYARRQGLTRAQLIARGLEVVLA